MKNLSCLILMSRSTWDYLLVWLFPALSFFFTSCSEKAESYSILEFNGANNIANYSKSTFLIQSFSDSLNPSLIVGSNGDLLMCDDNIFVFNNTSQTKFLLNYDDSALYVNNKITSIDLPGNDGMVQWFKDQKKRDFSALQFISFSSTIPESYLPCLNQLAKIKPDAGIYFDGDFKDLNGVLQIFNPRYLVGPSLMRTDYDNLSKFTNLELLTISIKDSVISDPLPALPLLKQIFLSDLGENMHITNDLLMNNRQIERVVINKSGTIDLALLNPVDNLKELVISGVDSIINLQLINNNKKLEVLSLTGDALVYDPGMIKLPSLRWIAFTSNVTQEEFNSFVDINPGLQIVEIFKNDTIRNLQPLSKLSGLFGLTITDTITDIKSIKTLRNLKYLSLPKSFLNLTINKAELVNSLPGTRIAANEGFCLGSGWILLLLPLILMIRFFVRIEKQHFPKGTKS